MLTKLRPQLVIAYQRKTTGLSAKVGVCHTEAEAIRPDWIQAERVFGDRPNKETPGLKQYYVKWCTLGYAESTWEDEADLNEKDQVSPKRITGISIFLYALGKDTTLARISNFYSKRSYPVT